MRLARQTQPSLAGYRLWSSNYKVCWICLHWVIEMDWTVTGFEIERMDHGKPYTIMSYELRNRPPMFHWDTNAGQKEAGWWGKRRFRKDICRTFGVRP